MSNETALTVAGNKVIERYGDKAAVIAFADRIMAIHPQAREVGADAMRTVAQLALMTGANPLPGTNGIHVWRDNKGKLCFQFGIGFWRGQAEMMGGITWVERPRMMTEAERKEYNIPNGTMAAIAIGALHRQVIRVIQDLRAVGEKISYKEAKAQVAVTGYAIASQNDYSKAGRSLSWSATERAERDLIRKLCPLVERKLVEAEEAVNSTYSGGVDWNLQQYGMLDSPDIDPDEDHNAALFGGAVEGSFEEVEETADTEIDEILAPFDWKAQAIESETLDGFCYSIYQLHKDAPVQVFKDAAEVKRGYSFMFGEFDTGRNETAVEGFNRYVNAIADGGAKKATAATVKAWYELETAVPEQPSLDSGESDLS